MQMRYLVEKIINLPKGDVKENEIELMQSFGQACVITGQKVCKENLILILDFFWDYLTGEESKK